MLYKNFLAVLNLDADLWTEFTGVRAMACGKTATVLGEASEALCCRRFALPILSMSDLLRGQERRRE